MGGLDQEILTMQYHASGGPAGARPRSSRGARGGAMATQKNCMFVKTGVRQGSFIGGFIKFHKSVCVLFVLGFMSVVVVCVVRKGVGSSHLGWLRSIQVPGGPSDVES